MTPRRARRRRGLYVALEGIDGAGKSTLVRSLGTSLRRRGLSVRLRREPVDRTIGRLAQEAGVRDPWTGAIYFTVDRHLALPHLERDLRRFDVVLTDRSFYSTVAYQGGRLGPRDRRRLEQLQRSATIVPDRVILLDLPVTRLRARLAGRAGGRGPLERARLLRRTAGAYRDLARRNGWIVLDATASPARLAREAAVRLEPDIQRVGQPGREKTLSASPGPWRAA